MDLYTFNPETGEFTGVMSARLDPMASRREGKDVYATPANATTIAPPVLQTGHARCFINGAWAQVEDHRGKTVYNTRTKERAVMTVLGPIPAGFTLKAPGAFDSWADGAWVTNKPAMQANAKQQAVDAIQAVLDAKAREYGFDSIHTAMTWIGCADAEMDAEAKALQAWGAKVWRFARDEWKNQEAGKGAYVTIEAFLKALPGF